VVVLAARIAPAARVLLKRRGEEERGGRVGVSERSERA